MKKFFYLVLLVLISHIISLIWWRSWMYEGFTGPPDVLAYFMLSDGERYYTLKEIEMFIVTLIILLIPYSFFKKIISKI
ncbi:hypothetical protein N473_22135 [Pseudoalteromonas luteoviolacea CPMOR-1]|uniref:Uncharacterized protein n=1 Tax=Pseudoalteromonas luteoviolacea CPMOR-1 TaxID=1365248 RepID=A0A167JXL3_9GAMM|nr:hypothetical protein N473_22135 [Pseudoalteromonas luteoviolacea CPMOR-1]